MSIEQQRCHQHCNVPVMCIHNTQHMTGDGQWPGARNFLRTNWAWSWTGSSGLPRLVTGHLSDTFYMFCLPWTYSKWTVFQAFLVSNRIWTFDVSCSIVQSWAGHNMLRPRAVQAMQDTIVVSRDEYSHSDNLPGLCHTFQNMTLDCLQSP